ncbi:ankyrin repeat-containing domain protein [Nemania abortiva]|nr:ankyrin repeat-containing domain protein [Nemania abortiva]
MSAEPPLWQEPPAFNLPCVPCRSDSPLPKSYAFLIGGIYKGVSSRLLEAQKEDFSADTSIKMFRYRPSMMVGAQATAETCSQVADQLLKFIDDKIESWEAELSITFFAYDLGGMILEQAFTNILEKDQYRRIIERTSLVVFYGTPHRSFSNTQTWAASVLRILHVCYKGLLGPWVPSYIERISLHHQKLDETFRMLSSGFHIMSICQKGPSEKYELVTDPSCAVLGVDNEETILLERSHYQLGCILGYQEREHLRQRMREAVIRHWKLYKSFMNTLSLVIYRQSPHPLKANGTLQESTLEPFLSDSKVHSWQTSSSLSTIQLILSDDIPIDDFYYTLTQHLTAKEDSETTIVLKLGLDNHYKEPLPLFELLASLCSQFLDQEPGLILWIRHLYPNLRDAILGVDKQWKLRALTRCLRTLLLAPKQGVTYCLIHHIPDHSQEDVIKQIQAAARESEVPLRLLVSTLSTAKPPLNYLEAPSCVDLSSKSAALRCETGPRGEFSQNVTSLALIPKRSPTSPTEGVITIDDMGPFKQKRRQPFDWYRNLRSPETVLSGCVTDNMAWVLHAVAWIACAIRPLSQVEVEQMLEMICFEEKSLPIEIQHGDALLQILESSLSGFLYVSEDTIRASEELSASLAPVWTKHGLLLNPELYVAQSCFTAAASILGGNSSEGAGCCTLAAHKLEVQEPGDSGFLAGTAKTHECATGHLRYSSRQAIAEYGARFWIQHQHRASCSMARFDNTSQGTLEISPLLNRKAWVRHFTSHNWSESIDAAWRAKINPDFMEQTYKLNPLDACYISLGLATLPLTPDDNLDWLFLSIASERLSEDAYVKLVMGVVQSLPAESRDSILCRVLSVASADLRSKLLVEYDDRDFFQRNLLGILLTAIATGNTTTVTELLTSAPNIKLGHGSEQEGDPNAFYLGTALQVACEYGDLDVARVLDFEQNDYLLELERSYRWNALHVACHQGHADLAKVLIDQSREHRVQILDPKQYSLLLVTSAHGLVAITESLKNLGIQLPGDDEGRLSPTQLAAKYGFPETLRSLKDSHNYKMLLKKQQNGVLSLAIQSRNENAINQAFEAFRTAIMLVNVDSHDIDNTGEDSDSDASTWNRSKDLREAVKIQGDALLTAIDCGGALGIIEFLLFSKHDYGLKDSRGRTPLMLASRIGSTELTRSLFAGGDQQDITKQTALHYACYHGHLEVVKILVNEHSVDLTIRDNESETPVMAAAMGGYMQIVELLLSRLPDKNRKYEFLNAAMSGHDAMMDMILRAATSMGFSVRGDYINAVDRDGRTPLHLAAWNDQSRVIQFLLSQRPNLDKLAGYLRVTPLAAAAHSRALESMKLLLDAGASTETFIGGWDKRLVLADSIFREQEDVVRLLLQYGAEPRLPDYWSRYGTLLNFTIAQNSTAVFKALLEYFDKVSKSVSIGPPPQGIPTATEALQNVIEDGRAEFFDTLIQVWDRFDEVTIKDGRKIGSPFKYAARYGSLEVLERLWERSKGDIDINETGGYYGTALQAAAMSSEYAFDKVQAILKWGALAAPSGNDTEAMLSSGASETVEVTNAGPLHGYWGTILHASAFSGDEKVIAAIMKLEGVSKDRPDRMGRLPLHLATLRGDWNITQKLSTGKSTVETNDFQGLNSLHMACGVGKDHFVEKLFDDPELTSRMINEADVDGWTPLHWACRSANVQLVNLLIAKGADKGARTRDGLDWLPYQVAVFHDWGPGAKEIFDLENTPENTATGSSLSTESGLKTDAVCSSCYCTTYGEYYQCTSSLDICASFNLCFKCYEHCEEIHFPDHQFE